MVSQTQEEIDQRLQECETLHTQLQADQPDTGDSQGSLISIARKPLGTGPGADFITGVSRATLFRASMTEELRPGGREIILRLQGALTDVEPQPANNAWHDGAQPQVQCQEVVVVRINTSEGMSLMAQAPLQERESAPVTSFADFIADQCGQSTSLTSHCRRTIGNEPRNFTTRYFHIINS